MFCKGNPKNCIGDSPRGQPGEERLEPPLIGRSGLFAYVPFDGMLNEFPRTAQRKFFFDVGLIRLNCLDAKVQSFGDLAGSVAIANQPEDFQFAIGEFGDRRMFRGMGAANVMLQHAIGDLFAYINFAA